MVSIDLNSTSFKSFQINMKFNSLSLAKGTAFFAVVDGKCMLMTNKHNVTGRDLVTGDCIDKNAAVPNKLSILIPNVSQVGAGFSADSHQWFDIPLYKDDDLLEKNWHEHPNPLVDVVAINFNPKEINTKLLVMSADESYQPIEVTSKVNILGFPFGISTDNFPIWSSGYIASEPAIDVNKLPLMYIDARTRQGQSGSPVVHCVNVGDIIEKDGKVLQANTKQLFLLGIYSGRINRDSDIGRVWKTSAIREVFAVAKV